MWPLCPRLLENQENHWGDTVNLPVPFGNPHLHCFLQDQQLTHSPKSTHCHMSNGANGAVCSYIHVHTHFYSLRDSFYLFSDCMSACTIIY